ncbi:putative Proteasome subunit beta type-3 [Blattamonas nauphoetae]|uniref:Proteasome subunit beta type-3 n=1 Tax=Blattamonas nauphoetae TaxID=2049346 RepID=A0ABQ9YEV0_9EUKA|nr:putative Proteasome subunit beta type-3 [Blattamonas nauphoetae]
MSNIMNHNGAAMLAMMGKECVTIGSDLTFNTGMQHQGRVFKVFPVTDKILLGLTGLFSDCQTFYQNVMYEVKLLQLKEGREIQPQHFGVLVAHMLYEKRFGPYFIEPLIAGLDEDNKPYIANTDTIGCLTEPDDFLVCGTAAEKILGPAESFWEEDLEAEELFEATAQALLAGIDRDSSSGWGSVVYTLTPQKMVTRFLRNRQD